MVIEDEDLYFNKILHYIVQENMKDYVNGDNDDYIYTPTFVLYCQAYNLNYMKTIAALIRMRGLTNTKCVV